MKEKNEERKKLYRVLCTAKLYSKPVFAFNRCMGLGHVRRGGRGSCFRASGDGHVSDQKIAQRENYSHWQ